MALNRKRILVICLKYGLFGLLCLVILVNLYLGINKAVTHNPAPKFLGMTPLIILSGSMKPAIMPGDVVIIREQASSRYELGDVATYLAGGRTYTHRIVGEADGSFILKGDSNNVADDTVTADRFIGKVVLRIPKVGLAILFFKTPPGMVLLLTLLVLILYGGDLYEKIRSRRYK